MSNYFSNQTVQAGYNVLDTLTKYNLIDFVWSTCNNSINENYHSANDSTQLFPNFLSQGYQILIYSGNTDAAVPFQYSRYCINNLITNYDVNLTQNYQWNVWGAMPNYQLGGWVESW